MELLPDDAPAPRTSMKATVAPPASRPMKLPTIGVEPALLLDEADAVLLPVELLVPAAPVLKGLLVPLRKEPDQPFWLMAAL